MPAGATNLNVLGPPSSPAGITYAETTLDAANGNKFDNDGKVILTVRNTTAGAIILDFYADTPEGNEVKVMSVSIPGSGTANGIKRLGPFPPSRYNNHNTTEAASSGKVIMKQASAGALNACAEQLNMSLLGSP